MSGVRLGSNIASLNAQRRLADATGQLGTSFERLASGMRINRASDDAAGLAISSALTTGTRVFTQAISNINDGISALSISEGALQQLTGISIRQRELAIQSANGVYSTTQRRALHQEANSLVDEFNRIVQSTTFNGQRLLDGQLNDLRIQAGYGTNGSINFALGEDLARTVGDGSFQSQTLLAAQGSADTVQLVDLNGDGKLDTISSGNSTYVEVRLGNGDGSFGAINSYLASNVNYGLETADFNRDGVLDIAVSDAVNGKVDVLLGNGNGTFKAYVSYAAAGTAYELTVGDFNSDGIMDIASANRGTGPALNTSLSVFLGNGDGSFKTSTSYQTGVGPSDIVAGDFNGDGHIDLVTSNQTDFSYSILLNNGNGSFKAASTFAIVAGNIRGCTLADIDRDGNMDVIGTYTSGPALRVFRGNGDGTFAAFTSFGAGNAQDVTVGDLNGDGYLDMISANYSNSVTYLLGNGNGTFRSAVTLTAGTNTREIALGDVNGDGAVDIVASNYTSSNLSIFFANPVDTSTSAYLNLNYRDGALQALTTIDETLARITSELGGIGSTQSRLSSALNTLAASRENYFAAAGRITNVDIADETAKLTSSQIRQQVASSVLAQANQLPALALRLLT